MNIIATLLVIFTASMAVPQIWKIHKRKCAKDLSILMYLGNFILALCWIAYNIYSGAPFIYVANAFLLSIIMGYILILTIVYR